MAIVSIIVFLTWIGLWLMSPCLAYQDPAFQQGLEMLQYQGVTPNQIKAWWAAKQLKRVENSPRVFPICITKDSKNGWPNALKAFGSHLDGLNNLTKYNPREHTWRHKLHKDLIRHIEFNSITAMLAGAIETRLELQQWIAIVITIRRSFKGLYVQSIGGPLGLPVGEFTLHEYRCKTAGASLHLETLPFIHLIPCSYTPRVSAVAPNVFVINFQNYAGTKTPARVAMQFRWSESQCHEMGYFQFMIFATKDFITYQSTLSPIYRYTSLQSKTGLHSPYLSTYNRVGCYPYSANPPSTLNDGKTRIIPNKEYDDCITKGIGRGATQMEIHTCPPDHFTCKKNSWSSEQEWAKSLNKWWKDIVEQRNNFQDCCELGPIKAPPPTTTTTTTTPEPTTTTTTTPEPTTTTTKTPEPTTTITEPSTEEPTNLTTTTQSSLVLLAKQDKRLTQKSKRIERMNQVTHGDLCILVWLILIPMADHIARFFKDLPDFKSVGLGFWIIAHILIHIVGLLMVWLSFGLVVGSGEDRLGNVSGRHFLLGSICTILQLVQFVTGLRRNQKERESFYYVLAHSLSGYISHFFGLVDVALSNAETERKWLSIGLFLAWLVCVIVTFFVEKKQEQMIGVVFHRAQCPILQRIVIDDRNRPPLMWIKIVIFGLTTAVQICLFTVMLVKYGAASTVDKKIRELKTLHSNARHLNIFSNASI